MHTETNRHAVLVTKHLKPGRRGLLRRDDSRNLLRRTLECYAINHGLVVYAWSATAEKVELVIELPSSLPLAPMLLSLFGYFTRRHNSRYRKSRGPIFRNRWLRRVLVGSDEISCAIRLLHEGSSALEGRARPGSEPFSSERAYSGRPDGVTTPWRQPIERRRAGVTEAWDAPSP